MCIIHCPWQYWIISYIHVNTCFLKSRSSFSHGLYDFTIIGESLSIFSHASKMHNCLIIPHHLLYIIEPETAHGRNLKRQKWEIGGFDHVPHFAQFLPSRRSADVSLAEHITTWAWMAWKTSERKKDHTTSCMHKQFTAYVKKDWITKRTWKFTWVHI